MIDVILNYDYSLVESLLPLVHYQENVFLGESMKTSIVIIVAVVLTGIALAQPVPLRNEIAPKAEDDFQLVKVADGVYAAIAKSGGLASGSWRHCRRR